MNQRQNVMFIDGDCKKVRRRRGERPYIEFTVENHVHKTAGVIGVDGVLQHTLLPYLDGHPHVHFEDNAFPHVACREVAVDVMP